MRITTVMMGNRYMANLQRNKASFNKAEQQSTDFRKFYQISDDPASAAKGFQLRREITKNEAQLRNAEFADGRMKTAESSMTNIQDQLKDIRDRLVQGNHGTYNPEDKETIAKELRGIQAAIVQELNVSYTDQYLFGGAVTGKAPVSVEDGQMLYRGKPLEQAAGETIADFEKRIEIYQSESIITDFGYGINGEDDDSGFDISLSAVNLMGYGSTKSESGITMSNNLYNLAGQMADYLEGAGEEGFDEEVFGEYIVQFDNVHKNFLNELTKMGEKAKTIEYTITRLKANGLALAEKQNYVENVEPEEALTNFKYQEFAYRAALAVGNKVIQPSLLDYLN